MTELTLPPLPRRMSRLPVNDAGYPVPWFVGWVDGKPDFRVIGPNKIAIAVRDKLCWLCGQQLGRFKAFVIGPMCAVNRVSAEPPSHRDCADYAARACPFLTNPERRRRENNLPEDRKDPAGRMLRRNPGVALVWITERYEIFRVPNGALFSVGDPTEALWYARGKPAARAEVLASIESGMPLLLEEAQAEGAEAVCQLGEQHAAALALLPDA